MLAAVTKAGVIHMICHNYRKAPAVTLAKQIIAKAGSGGCTTSVARICRTGLRIPRCPVLAAAERKGRLGRAGRHRLALARPGALSRRPVTEVTAALETFVKERPLPDNPKKKGAVTVDDASRPSSASRTVRSARSKRAGSRPDERTTTASRSTEARAHRVQPGTDERARRLLHHDDKRVQGFHNIMVTEPEHPYFKAWWPAGHIIGYEHTFIHTVYDLLEAIAKDKLPSPNFEDGVQNQKVLAAMEKSAGAKKWVKV